MKFGIYRNGLWFYGTLSLPAYKPRIPYPWFNDRRTFFYRPPTKDQLALIARTSHWNDHCYVIALVDDAPTRTLDITGFNDIGVPYNATHAQTYQGYRRTLKIENQLTIAEPSCCYEYSIFERKERTLESYRVMSQL